MQFLPVLKIRPFRTQQLEPVLTLVGCKVATSSHRRTLPRNIVTNSGTAPAFEALKQHGAVLFFLNTMVSKSFLQITTFVTGSKNGTCDTDTAPQAGWVQHYKSMNHKKLSLKL